MSLIGHTVSDRITGFAGIVTGEVQYITGCSQVLVAPKSVDGTAKTAEWFDVQRVTVDEAIERIVLDNGSTPGCDRAAPRR